MPLSDECLSWSKALRIAALYREPLADKFSLLANKVQLSIQCNAHWDTLGLPGTLSTPLIGD